jgi:hypothetical protein
MGKIWTKYEKEFVEKTYQEMRHSEIAHTLGRTTQSVALFCSVNKLHKKEIRLYDGNKKYSYNENYFDVPRAESAYWAGFIAADGCISTSHGCLILALKEEDRYQIENFKSALNYTGPITHKTNISGGKAYPYSDLRIYSAWPLIAQLYKHYGIGPRKTFQLGPPNLFDEQLIKAYIVGYIDGDGSIFFRGDRISLSLCGTDALLQWIKTKFDLWYPPTRQQTHVRRSKSIYEYATSGRRAEIILKDLSSLGVPFLKRKWDKVSGG